MMNNCGENSEGGNRGPAAGKTKGRLKKANESGAKIGVVVLSQRPREKPFSFGHPNIQKLLDRYLGENSTYAAIDDATAAAPPAPDAPLDHQERAILRELPGFGEFNKKLEEALEELEKEKNREKERENNTEKFWWDEEIEGMGLAELVIYLNAMEDLKKNAIARANALTMENVMENSAPADRDSGFGFPQNLPRSGGLP